MTVCPRHRDLLVVATSLPGGGAIGQFCCTIPTDIASLKASSLKAQFGLRTAQFAHVLKTTKILLSGGSRRIAYCLKIRTVHHLIVRLHEKSRKGRKSGDFLSTWPSVKRPRPRLAFRMCQAPSTQMISRLLSPCIKSQIQFQDFFVFFFVPLFPRKLGRTQLQALCLLLFKARGEKRNLHATSFIAQGQEVQLTPPPPQPLMLPKIATQKLEL